MPIQKTKWTDETYGEMPLKKVRKTVVKISELKTPPYAAHLQYNLLVQDPIIRASVNSAKGLGQIIYAPKDTNPAEIKDFLEKIKPYDLTTKHQVEIVSDEEMDYKDIVVENFNLTADEPADLKTKTIVHM